MSATLKGVRDTIADLWEALTPPTDTSTPYRRYSKLAQAEGVLTRRQFFFDLPDGGFVTQWGTEGTTLRSTFDAVVRIDVKGSLDDVFDAIADEATLLLNTVNLAPEGTWSNGVEFVRATGYKSSPADGYVELAFAIEAVTEETDGAP